MNMRTNRFPRIVEKTPDDSPLKVQKQFHTATTIPSILAKYGMNGIRPVSPNPEGIIVDSSCMGDYHENLIRIQEARDQFYAIDPKIREHFGNSPEKLHEFLMDSKNREQAIALGLLRPDEKPISIELTEKPTGADPEGSAANKKP